MTKTNATKNDWYTNNPFFTCKEAYEEFVEAMMMAADYGNLPIALEHNEPDTLTMDDIKSFSKRFKQDTSLNIGFKLITCNHCDRLHCIMVIDDVDENEMETNY